MSLGFIVATAVTISLSLPFPANAGEPIISSSKVAIAASGANSSPVNSSKTIAKAKVTNPPTPAPTKVLKPLEAKQKVNSPSVNEAAEDLSNRLPLDFVKEMINDSYWNQDYENPSSAANADINLFLTQLSNNQFSASELAEKMVVAPSTYSIKAHYLRYLQKQPTANLTRLKVSAKRIQEFKTALLGKYIDMTLALIRLSGISEYDPIVLELKRQISQHQIEILDLSPELRQSLGQEEDFFGNRNTHGYSSANLNKKDELGRYQISGLYSAKRKIIALDISRSIYEGLVTFGHEIVHAADPEVLEARKQMQIQFQNTATLFAEKIGTEKANQLLSALLQDVFFEMGRPDLVDAVRNDLVDIAQKTREVRIEDLQKSTPMQMQNELKLNPNVQGLMRNLIRVTVENEYKAYLFSLALYQTLSAKYQILPPSLDRKTFLQNEFKHQHSLQTTLSLAMNPFSKGSAIEPLRQDISFEQDRVIQFLKAILEINYLEQSKLMIEQTAARYENLFVIVSKTRSDSSTDDDFPEWTKPGKFDSASNPFQIVAAQVSTAHAIRFKANLDKFLRQMLDLQESLVNMNAGILDLHDLSIGETKLLGLHPIDISPKDILPQSIMEFSDKKALAKLLQDFNELNPELVSFLKSRLEINFTLDANGKRRAYSQQELLQNLFKLRLLKTVLWLKNDFPDTKDTFVGIRTVQAKLYEGQYNQKEISSERAQELIKELGEYINAASGSLDEMRKIDIYMGMLAEIYLMASQSDWSTLSQEYSSLMISAKRFLQNMGFDTKINVNSIKSQMAADTLAFHQQVKNSFRACHNDKIGFYPTNYLFKLGRFNFRLTALCYDNQLYVLRQPMDYNRAATTFIIEGRPELRVFMSAKPIRLEPLK